MVSCSSSIISWKCKAKWDREKPFFIPGEAKENITMVGSTREFGAKKIVSSGIAGLRCS